MATAGFPALAIRQPESPLQQFAQAQQVALGQTQLQQARMETASQQALMSIWSKNGGDMDQTIADARASGQVLPSQIQQLQIRSVQLQTEAARATEAQLANTKTEHGIIANGLEQLKALPQEQRTPDRLNSIIGTLGLDPRKYASAVQAIAQDPSDGNIRKLEIGFQGEQWVIDNELKQRQPELQQQQIALNKATIDKTIADTNEAAAKTSLDIKQAAQLGQVTPKDQYDRQTQLLKSVYDRQTTFGNTLYQSGLKQLDSMFTDPQHGYTQFLAQAQNTKNTIAQAKSGNEVAASLEPLMTALGVTSFAGVHRINQNEVNAAGPGVGSLYRQLNSTLSKMGSGSVPTDTLNEVNALVDGMIDSKHASLVQGANMVAANNGMAPNKVMVMSRDGTLTTLDQAGKNNPRAAGASAVPPGATHIVPGRDGKNHYTNAAGTVDLGIAP